MGFRYRHTVRVLPGMHLNLSQRGVSTTLGRAGLSLNVGPRGLRPSVGIPGTGIGYRFEPVGCAMASEREPTRSTLRGVIAIFAAMFAAVAIVVGMLVRVGRFLRPRVRVVASAMTMRLAKSLRSCAVARHIRSPNMRVVPVNR